MHFVELFCFFCVFSLTKFFLLSRMGADDEDELLGNADDAETRVQQYGSDGGDDIDVEDINVGSDDEDLFGGGGGDEFHVDDDVGSTKVGGRVRKRKHGSGVGQSPFVSLEEYEKMREDRENRKSKKLKGKEKNGNKKGAKNDKNKKRKKSD
jgi:hypothetical protein